MFFESWSGLGRVLVVGICAYAGLVLILRISGKRTLSKMNAFDFIVTVALGSTLASLLLSKDVPMAEGMLALALLVALQWVVAWIAVRSAWWRKVIKSEPQLLAFRGELIESALRSERISAEEIHSALRASGIASLADVAAVVLETDGTVAVVPSMSDAPNVSALREVRGFPSDGDVRLAEVSDR